MPNQLHEPIYLLEQTLLTFDIEVILVVVGVEVVVTGVLLCDVFTLATAHDPAHRHRDVARPILLGVTNYPYHVKETTLLRVCVVLYQ